MDERFTGPVELDSERAVTVSMYAVGVTLLEIANGSATVDVELTPFVSSLRQTQNELSVSLAWHLELYGLSQPKARRPVSASVNGEIVFVGLIETVNDYRLASGTRSMSITARSRDATPAWREAPRVTQDYPQGTNLDVIARSIAEMLLDPAEIQLPALAVSTPHSSAQLAGVSAWAMLESLLLPAGYSPAFDALGRLRAWSRDLFRPTDIVLTEEQLREVNGSRSAPALTRLQVKWLDPTLTRVDQQDRVLGQANITAGFFQIHQKQDVWFSDDHTQRARDTRMVVVQSANSGLFHVCSEDYGIVGLAGGEGDLHGRITLKTTAFVPALLGSFLTLQLLWAIPDIAPPFGGPTTKVGGRIAAAFQLGIMCIMASMGTGSYEVWGVPYDYVHGRNTTEAYDDAADPAADKVQTVESDFVMSEEHAQAFAAREFLFAALSASSYGLTMVDDLRVQEGDIIELPDGTRVFVTGYQRDLGHGAPALLSVQGFQIPAGG